MTNAKRRHLFVIRHSSFGIGSIAAATLILIAAVSNGQPPTGTSWALTFGDQFYGTSLDNMKWSQGEPWNPGLSTPSDISVNNGLTLTSVRTGSSGTSSDFTNSFISTENTSYNELFGTKYGYVEASMKLPSTPGSWPAFWMLASGWPPEIDIMEDPVFTTASNSNYNYSDNIHYTSSGTAASLGNGPHYAGASDLTQSFNTYGVAWSPTAVSFYCDGILQTTITNSTALGNGSGDLAGNGPMYLLLDMIGGGSWPGVPSTSQWAVGTSASLQVQWVKVWEGTSGSATSISWNNTASNGQGSWTSGSVWSGGAAPQLSSQTAIFGANAVNNQLVTWNDSQTIGGLTFNSSTSYTVGSAAGSLMLANTSVNTSGVGSGGSVLIDATSTSGTGANYLNSRLELWSNVTMQTSSKPLIVNGSLIGNGNLTIAAGPITLAGTASYTGGTTLNGGTLTATGNNALGSGAIQFNTGGNGYTAELALAGGIEIDNPITLTARNNSTTAIDNASGNNTLGGPINLQVGGANYLIESDSGQLNVSGGSSGTAITLGSGVGGTRTVTFFGAGNTLVSGALANGNSGSLAVIANGPGILELSASNSYTKGTVINGGTLLAAQTYSLSNYATSGSVSLASGATLAVEAGGPATDWTSANIAGLLATSIFPAGSSFGISVPAASNTYTYSSNLAAGQANKGFTKLGAGLLILAGTNTYTGTTTFAAGALQISNSSSLPTASNLTFQGGTMQYSTAGTLVVSNPVVSSSASTMNFNVAAGSLQLNGNLASSNSGGLFVYGAGMLILSNSNSYSGTTTIGTGQGPGTVRAMASGAFGTSTITYDGQGNASTALLQVTNNITLNNPISLVGRNSGTPAIENVSGNNTLSGGITLQAGGTYYIQSDSGQLALSGGTSITSNASGTRNLNLQGNGNGLISGTVVNGAATGGLSLTNRGSGTWTLSNTANSYTGGTNINAGIMKFTKAQAMPATGAVSVGGSAMLAVNAGGIGEFTSATGGSGSIGGLLAGVGGQGGPVHWSAGAILGIDTTDAPGGLTYGGNISNTASGSLGLTELGSGALTLAGSNTYTGGTDVAGGILILNSAKSLEAGTSLILGSASQRTSSPAVFAAPLTGDTSAASDAGAVAPVPEPGTLALVATGAGFAWIRWRMKRRGK